MSPDDTPADDTPADDTPAGDNAAGSERQLREQIATLAASLFDRGLTAGSSGNISVRLPDGILVTPTNSCLGRLDPDRISKVDPLGNLISGDKPSKEAFLHHSVYSVRDSDHAIVHLHSTHSVAVSCLADIDDRDVLPPITAYYVMRVGRLPMVPYFPPGDPLLAGAVETAARHAHAVLLANHGPVVASKDLNAAVNAIEELEETAKLFLMLRGERTKFLTAEQADQLRSR
ncbi:MAG: 3-oxo-tetronate 4-phosphate decarboxylase [Planctomycetota bacterium]